MRGSQCLDKMTAWKSPSVYLTNINEKTSTSKIDHITTNFNANKTQIIKPHVSDHMLLFYDFKIKVYSTNSEQNKKIAFRDMRKENLLGLNNYLKYYNFGKVYELQNVDESYHEFTGILEYIINMCCPRRILL